MKHTVTVEIPDGKYCNPPDAEPCPCLVGELHSLCFVCQNADLEEDDELVIKAADCPNSPPCERDDCQMDKDYCCDCNDGSLYRSPDQPDWREDR